MAAPSYTTDLTTFNDCTSTTGWIEFTGMAVGGGATLDSDLGIFGSVCISELIRKTGLASLAYDFGSGVTIPTDGGFFAWSKYQAPNSIEIRASGGVIVAIGSSATVWGAFNMDGSDTYPYGGWVNYFVDPTLTPDIDNGGYTTTYQFCGTGINVTNVVSKGNPQSIDIIRYGRGKSIFTDGDAGNGYATFDGYALVNDNATTGRFGLLQDQGGSYLWKGLMSLGSGSTSVGMVDSNVNITIDDTIKASPSFNRIEVHNSGSTVDWTSVNITKVGTVSRGEFEMIDNATVNLTTCTFSDMSTFDFQSNATLTNVSFIRCDQVTQGGCDIIDSTFSESLSGISLTSTDLDLIDNCSFTSEGSNHAVELTSIGGGSMGWNGTLTNYVAGASGSPAATGATGNEAIYVNVTGGTLSINVAAGATIPSIRTNGAIVNVVAGQVTTQLIVTDIDTNEFIQNARVLVEAVTGATGTGNYRESVSITRSGTVATVAHTSHALVTGNKVSIRGADDVEYDGVKTITVNDANEYTYTIVDNGATPISPATGTLTSTDVYISDVTDVNGEISDTRSFSENQPISGRVRRATTGDLYRTSRFNSTIDSGNGVTLNISLISDE